MNDPNLLFSGIEQKDLYVFELLYEIHYSRLCSIAERIVKNQAQAEIIVMNVFGILWNTRMKYDNLLRVKSFLFRSVFDHSLNVVGNNLPGQIIIHVSEKVKERTVFC
jgi:DNA-directed RNA polymerase specialized sigma24 family protein